MTDRAFMSSKQLYVEDQARESYQSRLRSKIKEISNDKGDMLELISEYLPEFLPELMSLARDFDADVANDLSVQLQKLVRSRAKSLTPESIEEDYS